MQAFYLRVSLAVHILHKTLDRDVHLISRFLEKVTLCCHHETHGRSCVPASDLRGIGGADVHSTRLSLITYTNPPNKGHTRNHSFTSSHLQSHLQPRSVTHTLLSHTHKFTVSPLTLSGLKPTAPQTAIITSLPLCLSAGSLLHVVELNQPAVWLLAATKQIKHSDRTRAWTTLHYHCGFIYWVIFCGAD